MRSPSMPPMIPCAAIEPVLPSRRAWDLHDQQASRSTERIALEAYPAHAVMSAAGFAVARLACAIAPHARHIWVAAGPGNNGGDGLVAARALHAAGRRVSVTWLGDPATAPADALRAWRDAQLAGVQIDHTPPPATSFDLCIDALLGLGNSRPATGTMALSIEAINAQACPVLSIDLPSGLDCNTGQAWGGVAVRATHTLSLLSLKPGLFTGHGRDQSGQVWLCGLVDLPSAVPASAHLVGPASGVRRLHAQHKGSFGDVIVLGGAQGMVGAAWLAACAALTAGAGRVYASRFDASATQETSRPELMWRLADELVRRQVMSTSTVVCGCGGGDALQALLPTVLHHAVRLVLDADALNSVAADQTLRHTLQARQGRGLATILTPHPLEAARLLAISTADIQADRLASARALSELFSCTVLLKGSGTVIAAADRLPAINPTGNARLASPGSGDVLAGWLGGLWSQASDDTPFDLACAAAWQHGAAAEQGPIDQPLRAADLIEHLASPAWR